MNHLTRIIDIAKAMDHGLWTAMNYQLKTMQRLWTMVYGLWSNHDLSTMNYQPPTTPASARSNSANALSKLSLPTSINSDAR
ncbi:hypothetical protein D3C80_1107530 [compost metagenome]